MAPFLINFCACIVVIVINRALLGYGGDIAVGAYGIVMRLLMLFGMSVVGLGQGMQPIVGFNYGARRPDRVRMTLKYATAAGTAVTLAGMLSALLIPELLVSVFTSHPELSAASCHALRLCSAMFVLVGPQIVIGTYFQSIGQSKIASVISMGRQMLFLVPCLFILPRFLGLDGVWLSMPCADVFGAALSFGCLYFSLKAEDNRCDPSVDPECRPPSEFFRPKGL
ncbi:MAG: hypothetical protein MJ061_05785 [Mailhella sp.]|nr:hypothetical protein [Mailhella sp.]